MQLDGVYYWWPDGIRRSYDVDAYIEAFLSKGFEVSNDFNLEKGILKVALYENSINGKLICSHAARQKLCGTWMSKLGQSYDIEHESPFSIEGNFYGRVYCCLKIKRYKI